MKVLLYFSDFVAQAFHAIYITTCWDVIKVAPTELWGESLSVTRISHPLLDLVEILLAQIYSLG